MWFKWRSLTHLRSILLTVFWGKFWVLSVLALKLVHSLMSCLADTTRCLSISIKSWGSCLTVESRTKICTIFCRSILQTVRILFKVLDSNCRSGLSQLWGSLLNYHLSAISLCTTAVHGRFASALRYGQFPWWLHLVCILFLLQGYEGSIQLIVLVFKLFILVVLIFLLSGELLLETRHYQFRMLNLFIQILVHLLHVHQRLNLFLYYDWVLLTT